jgi:5-methyltetrahydrofolate--homocysteine methyltransferase
MMSRFLNALSSGRVLLMDGAMGTELIRAGLAEGESADLWTAYHPERVLAVHQAYHQAGAEVLLTNTFQLIRASISCPSAQGPHGPVYFAAEHKTLLALYWSACTLARAACGPDGFVIEDIGSFTAESSGQEFADLSLLRLALGNLGPADAVLLETCYSPRVRLAIHWLRKLRPDLPVLLSLAYRKQASGIDTITGHSPAWFAARAAGYGVAALGVNCGRDIGMAEILEIVRQYRQETDLPLFVRPNAGTPGKRGKQLLYPLTPEQMADQVPALVDAGVTMIGGCCGTTPLHIAACRQALARHRKPRGARRQGASRSITHPPESSSR